MAGCGVCVAGGVANVLVEACGILGCVVGCVGAQKKNFWGFFFLLVVLALPAERSSLSWGEAGKKQPEIVGNWSWSLRVEENQSEDKEQGWPLRFGGVFWGRVVSSYPLRWRWL